MKPVLFFLALSLLSQAGVEFAKPYQVGEEKFSLKGKVEMEGATGDVAATITKRVTKVGDDGAADLVFSYTDRTMTFNGQAISDVNATKNMRIDKRGVPLSGDESLRGDVVKLIFLRPAGAMKVGDSQKVEWNEAKNEKVTGTLSLVSVKDKIAKFNLRLAAPGPEKGSVVDVGVNTFWNLETETLTSADGAIVPRKSGQFKRFVFNVNKA